MINLVIPMAGAGSRFAKHGFTQPKPLIDLHNEKFFYWASLSILKFLQVKQLIFVVLKEHVQNHQIDKIILKYYPQAEIQVIENILNGAAFSLHQGIEKIKNNSPIIALDCDSMWLSSQFINYVKQGIFNEHGGLFTFFSNKPLYSYAKINTEGYVEQTAEKQVISNNAIGAYMFQNKEVYLQYFNTYTDIPNSTEYYISGIFNKMIEDSCKITTFLMDFIIPFGIPEEFIQAQNNKLFELMKQG